jgi:membrane associated rhomboid family serine protease
MFAVYMFGAALENIWGSRKFLFYYLVTGVGAGIVQQLFWTIEFQPFINAMNDSISANPAQAGEIILHKINQLNLPITIGASGSVFGLLLAFGWLFPEARLMMIFFPVPIKARVFVLIYGVIELFQGVANFSGDNVAHFAHLGGMLFGVILLLIWKKKRFL